MKRENTNVKRDNTLANFDAEKIVNAIAKAGIETCEFGFGVAKTITEDVVASLDCSFIEGAIPTVENVQDIVETEIFRAGYIKTGKAYVLYRSKRSDVRNLDRGLDMIDEYLEGSDWRLKENSNMSFSLQGLNNHISGAVSAKYWLEKIYSKALGNAHKSGDLHAHDLGLLGAYCVGWDLMDLLLTGFRGVKNKVSAGPAKHFGSALGQIFNFLYTMQGEAAGAQALSSFDTLLAPYVRHDKLTYKQVKQKMQEFVFNMNTSTRVGFSVPFTNLTFDLTPSPNYAKSPAIIGGQPWLNDNGFEYLYGDFQAEMDMINRAFAEVMCQGDYDGRVFTFPIPTYNITAEFDWENPVYQAIWEMAGKYGIPYFSNFIGSDLNPEDVRSMCPLHPDELVVFRNTRGIAIRPIGLVGDEFLRGGQDHLEVLHKGSWVPVSGVLQQPSAGCVLLEVANSSISLVDIRHRQPVKQAKGAAIEILKAGDIQSGMFVPFSADRESGKCTDSFEAGFAVGAFVGDGSYSKGRVVYSLGTEKIKQGVMRRLSAFFEHMGLKATETVLAKSCSNLGIGGPGRFAEEWMRLFVFGSGAHEKRIDSWTWGRGRQFLEGILAGWYATDGGNRGRIYTVNPGLCDDFATLCGLLGKPHKIDYIGDRRAGRLGTNPIFACKYHTRESYGNWYFKEDGYWWFPVKSVVPVKYSGSVFCLQVRSEEHLFQLANGLVTHNCS